jgi:tryptophanyl-tRNA synthetase
MSRVNLGDDSDLIAQKIRKAKTDAEPLPESVDGLEGRPEARNLVAIFAALTGREAQAVLDDYAGQGFGAFKPALADLLVETMRPIKARLDQLKADPAELDSILVRGSARATSLGQPTLAAAYEALGLQR